MMNNSNFYNSIGYKILMSLSGIFLMLFLLQHFVINFTSIFSEEIFNTISHFMGNNPIIQFALQPVLISAVIFHFVMGLFLELKNKKATQVSYVVNKGSKNSSWMSRNMIISGLVILAFLGLHFYDYWIPEINYKYITVNELDSNRYFNEMTHKFHNPFRVIIYVISFIFLSLHLLHGFKSSFQSLGISKKKITSLIEKASTLFAISIPSGFIFIAIYHYITQL